MRDSGWERICTSQTADEYSQKLADLVLTPQINNEWFKINHQAINDQVFEMCMNPSSVLLLYLDE